MVVTKLTYRVAIIGCHVTAWLPAIVRFMTKQNSMVKGIDDAFDHYGLVFCLINRRIISVKISLFFQEINFITESLGSNFLLPTFSTDGKMNFQVANLLLAIINFEPWIFRSFWRWEKKKKKKNNLK